MARPSALCVSRSAVPAELLWLAGGALRDDDVDEGGAAVVHRLVEGALQVFRVLDEEALAVEGFHRPIGLGDGGGDRLAEARPPVVP